MVSVYFHFPFASTKLNYLIMDVIIDMALIYVFSFTARVCAQINGTKKRGVSSQFLITAVSFLYLIERYGFGISHVRKTILMSITNQTSRYKYFV